MSGADLPIDEKAAAIIRPHLFDGERLIWCERPGPNAVAGADRGAENVLVIPFGLLVIGLGAALIYEGVASDDWSLSAWLMMVPVLMVGVPLALAPWIHTESGVQPATYALTDLRIIVRTSGPQARVRSYILGPHFRPEAAPGPMGRGVIVLKGSGTVGEALAYSMRRLATPSDRIMHDVSQPERVAAGIARLSSMAPERTDSPSGLDGEDGRTDPRWQAMVGARLYPDEHLIWSGLPGRRFAIRRSDIGHLPSTTIFAILLTVFPGGLLASDGSPGVSEVISLIAFAAAFYLIAGRIFYAAFMRHRSAYALTDQRILTLHGDVICSLRAAELKDVWDVTLYDGADDSRNILFGEILVSYRRLMGLVPVYETEWFRIDKGARVYEELIRRARLSQCRSGAS